MDHTILGTLDLINFSPGSVLEEIIQNVKTLLTTRRWSVPLDRQLGLDMTVLDAPMSRAVAALRVEVIEALRKYEPRCRVKRVDFDGDTAGRLVPKVTVMIDA